MKVGCICLLGRERDVMGASRGNPLVLLIALVIIAILHVHFMDPIEPPESRRVIAEVPLPLPKLELLPSIQDRGARSYDDPLEALERWNKSNGLVKMYVAHEPTIENRRVRLFYKYWFQDRNGAAVFRLESSAFLLLAEYERLDACDSVLLNMECYVTPDIDAIQADHALRYWYWVGGAIFLWVGMLLINLFAGKHSYEEA